VRGRPRVPSTTGPTRTSDDPRAREAPRPQHHRPHPHQRRSPSPWSWRV